MLRDALLVHNRLGDRWRLASVLEELVGSVLAGLDPRLAVSILACSEALRTELGAPIPLVETPDYLAVRSRLQHKLSRRAFAEALSEGRELTREQAVDRVLEAIARLRPEQRGADNAHHHADPHTTRISGPGAGGQGSHQPRDRRVALHEPEHSRGPRFEHPAEAGSQTTRRCRRIGTGAGVGPGRLNKTPQRRPHLAPEPARLDGFKHDDRDDPRARPLRVPLIAVVIVVHAPPELAALGFLNNARAHGDVMSL